jgi:excisionase family DNA binding protein
MSNEHTTAMTLKQAAAYLGVEVLTVKKYIASGQLAAFPIMVDPACTRPHYRVLHEDMQAFLATRKTLARKICT